LGGDEGWRKGKVIGRWEQERKEFYRERRVEEIEKERIGYDELERRDRQNQKREKKERMEISKYNKWYKEFKKEGYLFKGIFKEEMSGKKMEEND